MASQHFYTRVPARISMFNRADSFDTFACSENLDREFIEKDLAVVCENKLTPDDTELMRLGKLPPLFCQFCTKDGVLVQSKTTYVANDYTGERSSYMVQNIVYDDKEQKKIFENSETGIFNKAMFIDDPLSMNIDDPNKRADDEYPACEYVPAEKPNISGIMLEKFELKKPVLERFIYASLATVCGKIKNFYFKLGSAEDGFEFMNAFLQIIPYHLRPYMSFATRVSDVSKLRQIKIKRLSKNVDPTSISGGAYIDLKHGFMNGFKDDDVAAYLYLLDFIYETINNDALRVEFLRFCDNAVKKVPNLAKTDLNTISNLVFLFKSTCGMYSLADELPNDDKVLEFVTLYEKTRAALPDENRINGMKCLERYPKLHMPIPKTVFAKVSKVYPGDIIGVRRVIMSVVLEFIHTDVMRDKLFAFVKNNYEIEDMETKGLIMEDLCKVYYGGFLQPQILEFFNVWFDKEPENIRDNIVDKILLSIRTKNVQKEVLAFIEAHYINFSPKSKELWYETAAEQSIDGDELSSKVIDIINTHIVNDESYIDGFLAKIFKLIEKEQKKKSHPMLAMLAAKNGFVSEKLQHQIVENWSDRVIFEEYVDALSEGDFKTRVEKITAFGNGNTELSPEISEKLSESILQGFEKHPVKADVYELLETENSLGDSELEKTFRKNVLNGMVKKAALDVFKHKDKLGGAELISRRLGQNDAACDTVARYIAIKNAVTSGSASDFSEAVFGLAQEKGLRKNLSTYFDAEMNGKIFEGNSLVLFNAAKAVLKNNTFGFAETNDALNASAKEQNATAGDFEIAVKNARLILFVAAGMSLKAGSDENCDMITSSDSGIPSIISAVCTKFEKKGVNEMKAITAQLPASSDKFKAQINALVEKSVPAKKSFFASLFKKH